MAGIHPWDSLLLFLVAFGKERPRMVPFKRSFAFKSSSLLEGSIVGVNWWYLEIVFSGKRGRSFLTETHFFLFCWCRDFVGETEIFCWTFNRQFNSIQLC